MAPKIMFTKEYERDISLVVEEAWAQALPMVLRDLRGAAPVQPLVILFADRNSLQIWECRESIEFLKAALLERNSADDSYVDEAIEKYRAEYANFAEYWQHPTRDISVLENYMAVMRRAVQFHVIWYYTAQNEKTPPDIRTKALEVRAHDEFFSHNDLFIKKCCELMGAYRRYANLVFTNEFPNIPPADVLARRGAGVVSVNGKQRYTMPLSRFEIQHPEFDFVRTDLNAGGTGIIGQSAFPGVVRGVARIVKNEDQMTTVKEGDILVTPMTTPHFLSAMQRAAGFVTDEGGITCHAAITAREMKKPCIIGTKIATKVFKDGDMVEVDADRGIVRLI